MATTLNDEIVERFQRLDRANRKQVLQTLLEVLDSPKPEDEEARLEAQLEARKRMEGMLDTDITDASITIKEGMRDYFKRKYGDID